MTRYIYEGGHGPLEIDAPTAGLLQGSRSGIRYHPFEVYCATCLHDETCCRNHEPEPPRPSLWRRLRGA